MKILIVEDTAPKYTDIQTELKKCGESTFYREKTLADAKRKIEESCKENEMFDLIVTDMNFPDSPGGEENEKAGVLLIEFVNSLNVLIPMIICSSVRCRVDMENVLGSVHYSKNKDWEAELRQLLRTITPK